MDNDSLRYDEWIEQALREVIRSALSHAAAHGLDGDHHFYINFSTTADGVSIPPYLRAEHPEEMTIVLQHQFSDLAVEVDAFSVSLSFRGKAEHLRIPLAAVNSFSDPSVNFGLQLKMMLHAGEPAPGGAEAGTATATATGGDAKTAEVIALDTFRKK